MQSVHKSINARSRRICSVPQCSTYCTTNTSLHTFPLDPKLRMTWKSVLKIGKPVTKYMLVCSQHFTNTDFTIETNKRRRLKKNVIPSKNIPDLSHSILKTEIDRSKRHWLQKCTSNISKENAEMEEDESLLQTEDNIVDMGEELAITARSNNKSVLASHVGPFLNDFTGDKETQTEFCDFFELPQILNSDEKLINFCGITFDILTTITKCAENTANFNKCNWSNIKTRIILALCKVKLNISFACLAVLFKLSNTQCRSIFYSTVSLLAVSLKPAIYWPTKEQILNNMPHCFHKFKNTRVVLDCTEIKIQKLKCLKCRVASYSHYKGMHTLKYLIGITPSGLISFVSAGFGGRATDKAIFNYENLIDKLEMNDAVMVDKGILIENECNEKLVKLIRPPFLKKQKQFSKADAEATADIARARVHVERAIQRIKMFNILSQQFNWYLIPYADEIITIIAAIVNLSAPILSDSKINS